MSKDSDDEEERKRKEMRETQEVSESAEKGPEFYSDSHRRLHRQEIRVFSGGDGTFLNQAMFDHFGISSESTYEEKSKQLRDQIKDDTLEAEKKRELYEVLRNKVDGALKSGHLKDITPDPHPTNEDSVSYKIGESSLDQTELDGGMFKFSPDGKFTGVLRVERRDKDGELIPHSADIIEYKNGKPVSVIPGPEGETRVADFGLIAQQAGISVSKFQETGVSVSRAKEEGAELLNDKQKEDKAVGKAGPLVKSGQVVDQETLKKMADVVKTAVNFKTLNDEKRLAFNSVFGDVMNGIKGGQIDFDQVSKQMQDMNSKNKGQLALEDKDSKDEEKNKMPDNEVLKVAAVATILMMEQLKLKGKNKAIVQQELAKIMGNDSAAPKLNVDNFIDGSRQERSSGVTGPSGVRKSQNRGQGLGQ